MATEYAIFHGCAIHRYPYATEDQARQWIKEWIDDGGSATSFHIRKREISDWEFVGDED